MQVNCGYLELEFAFRYSCFDASFAKAKSPLNLSGLVMVNLIAYYIQILFNCQLEIGTRPHKQILVLIGEKITL